MPERSETAKRKILKEAKQRFQRSENWESTARARYIDDLKFSEADSDNLWQWPTDIREGRETDQKPMLTVNKTNQHCLDVLNDARQSRVAIKIRPTGDGASVDSAQVYMGVVRHIEYISNANTAYQTALNTVVRGGFGYWRLITGYSNDDSFDQEIFIRRVKDPLTVYLDPDINEFDGSDARFGFVFTDTPKDEFLADHPEMKEQAVANTKFGGTSWVKEDTVRTAEYFRRVEVKDRLMAYPDPDDESGEQMKVVRESEIDKKLAKLLISLPTTKMRSIKSHKVEWFKIVGDEIVDEKEWLGVYIPIIRVVGVETVIDGELDRKGHTRALKDPNRIFNYNASASIEYGALQSRTPYMGPMDAFEGYETFWDTANKENHSYLPFNHRDDEGNEIPAPVRQLPPTGAPVFMQGMHDAAEWMRMVSGQYQSDMGAPSNERSGVAIQQRQRQGDNATYHFLDHQAISIRLTGKQLIDLIPKIYDTKRILKIMDEDGTENAVTIDPNAKEALTKQQKTQDEVETIFNPNVGKYEVESDVGPAYATKRQEAFDAYTQFLAQNKDLTSIIGDLMMRAADFPGAEEAAERLKRMVPKQALEDGPSPDMLQAQQQIEALQNLVKEVTSKLADKTAAHLNDQEKLAVTAYDSQTKRLAALKDALNTNPELLVSLVAQVILEAEATSEMGLRPALTPSAELTAENMSPPEQAPQPQPQLMAPGAGGDAPPMAPNVAPDDMTTGPAPMPGGAPTPDVPV